MSIKFELGGLPPTPNVPRHWAKRHRDNAQWTDDTIKAAKNAMNRTPGTYPVKDPCLTFVHYHGTRNFRDEDNAIAALKPVLDGIVRAGLIEDDSLKVIGGCVIHRFDYRKGRPGLLVEVASRS